jgi:hypothetical protein
MAWRFAQGALWVAGLGLLVLLAVRPQVGLPALWNVLIPVAPALLAFAPGIWRNICPLGSTSQLPRMLCREDGRTLSSTGQGRLHLIGVLLLVAIVPLRHVILNMNGPVTAAVLLVVGAVALVVGWSTRGKSGWCAGLCPVHPVERLYGFHPAVTVKNAHCQTCVGCSVPCPDSTTTAAPVPPLVVGGFAGFVWGWFQVPDTAGWGAAYAWPLVGMSMSLAAYWLLRLFVPRPLLARAFAAAAIGCYYWFRIPMLFGFGTFPGDGMLVDLSRELPAWFPVASRIVTTSVFAAWMVVPRAAPRGWSVRPVAIAYPQPPSTGHW